MVIVVAFKATAETLVGGEGAEMSKVITLLFNSLKKKKTTKKKTKKKKNRKYSYNWGKEA